MSVVRQLLDAGLLDELHLFVHPATAGSGLRLFEEGGPARHLKLMSSQPFSTGVLYVVYGPDPNPPTGSYDEAKETLPLLNDFWNLPEYAKMLDLQEKTLNAAVVNQTDAKAALDKIAKGQQQILSDAGYS